MALKQCDMRCRRVYYFVGRVRIGLADAYRLSILSSITVVGMLWQLYVTKDDVAYYPVNH